MEHRIWLSATIIASMATIGTATAQVTLSSGERRCVTSMNKGYERMAKTYGKAISRCLKDAGEPGASQTFDDCVAAARASRRVAKVEAALAGIEASRCSVAPPYAFTGAATVADAAVDQELEIVDVLFGSDLGLAVSTSAAECQVRVLEAAQRCRKAVLSGFNRCKKKTIRDTTDEGEAPGEWLARDCMLEGIVTENGLTGKPRRLFSLCRRNIGDAVNSNCQLSEVAQLFPGECGSDVSLTFCIRDRVPRAVCRGLDVADDLGVDGITPGYCDVFND